MSNAMELLPSLIPKSHLLRTRMRKYSSYYVFVVPGLLFFALFQYAPIYFIQIAFRDYNFARSLADSPWVGFRHFQTLFRSNDFPVALANTLIIGLYKVIFEFPIPVILALLLNELRSERFKRVAQSIMYLPHFISWAVIGGIMMNFMTIHGGLFNTILMAVGAEPISFLSEPRLFRPILIVSSIWKDSGWGTIIYLAAISSIDIEQYESAHIDGASRLQEIWYITIPSILNVIFIMLIIRLGRILTIGFGQILMLYRPIVRDTGLVIDYLVYDQGLRRLRYSYAAAAGVFKTVVAAIMVVTADRVAKTFGERGLF